MSQVPLGAAVLSWGLSFFFGTRNVEYENSNLFANYDLVRILGGAHPDLAGRHPDFQKAAASGISEAMELNAKSAGKFARWQFRLLVLGALFYLGWHVLEMAQRASVGT